MQYKTFLLGIMGCCLWAGAGCKRFVAVGEPDFGIVRSKIFNNDQAAQAAVVNMYVQMQQGAGFTNGYGSKYAALYADELRPVDTNSAADRPFYNQELSAANTVVDNFWSRAYTVIYVANAVLEGLANAPAVTDSLRRQMMGEAYFVRALHYFYLVGLFGEVPLPLTTDYYTNRMLPRSPVQEVYKQIGADLQAAVTQLPVTYFRPGLGVPGNIRATRWAATALLARAMLYQGNWQEARSRATQVIEGGGFSLAGVDSVFLLSSPEIIFQLQPVALGANSAEGRLFLPPAGMPPYEATQHFLSRLEAGDARRQAWLNSYPRNGGSLRFPYKYKERSGTPVKEYTVVLRLAELYLIRAEASARLGMLEGAAGALQDLNAIQARAQLAPLPASMDQQAVLAAIEQERAVELWAEWGHRLADLRRWPGRQNPRLTRLDEVMQACKPGWEQYQALWPIPEEQLTLNVTWQQNGGY